jgi:hypothetical protein
MYPSRSAERATAAVFSSACILLALTGTPAPALRIDADYPGGNVVLDRVEGDHVFLHQDLRDTKGWWFYWGFRVRDAGARRLTFHFTNENVIGVRGPAVSRDAGATWEWLGTDTVRATSEGVRFSFPFRVEDGEVRFCFAVPYQEADLDQWLARLGDSGHLRRETLCKTRCGRTNRFLRVGCLDAKPRHRVLLTCRNHACESLASYTMWGLLETVLGEDATGEGLRRDVEFLVVPFVDLDGVERGDQGKNRKPRDHNRDYGGVSLYPSVRALREYVPAWSDGRLAVAIDLHCPYIRGRHNEAIYLVGSDVPAVWTQQCAFAEGLESCRKGPLLYSASDNIPFGKAWNTGANFRQGTSCSRWAQGLPGVKMATTIEIPYANAGGRAVTAETARAFGADLARALASYLRMLPAVD